MSAVIVTRGDVDLKPILATLPYEDVVIWDNARRGHDAKCYGRWLGSPLARHDVIYYQDDDLLFTEHDALLDAYRPGRITANMPSPWYENRGYPELGCVLVGAGALVPRELPGPAFSRYLAEYEYDDLFRMYCDLVAGILTPSHRVDLGYEVLPCASAPNRIWLQPGADERRQLVIERALAIRDRQRSSSPLLSP